MFHTRWKPLFIRVIKGKTFNLKNTLTELGNQLVFL
uniref:Uncharacterized protein n=1 Tax=Anguilla anguilla TaxID=7936 RepID=A0A0E9QIP2_ANGAN